MPIVSVGDMAQHFISMRNGSNIKTQLSNLAEQLSTGQVTDIASHLQGQTTQFSGINHSLTLLNQYSSITQETEITLTAMQTVMDEINTSITDTAGHLLLVSNNSSDAQVTEAAFAARSTFDGLVALLNTRVADRAIFGGTEVEMSPLTDPDAMLADLQAAVGTNTSHAGIMTAIDTWFDDPSGGFSTVAYQGDTGNAPQKRISNNTKITVDARADDPAFRAALKSAAIAAIVHEAPTLSLDVKSELLQNAGINMHAAASDLTSIQSRIGYVEEIVAREQTEIGYEATALSIAKNNLISADPFDTAARLQAVQIQLETHYAATAQISQLSLLSYL